MRKLLRSIARARMKEAGVQQMNKPRKGLRGEKLPSKFAENWRNYL